MPAITALALALIGAALMGIANHRGSTCLVAAVSEIVTKRRAWRLMVLVEASAWALVFGVVLAIAGWAPAAVRLMPPASGLVVAGGVLLGFGAWLNGACIFGTVVRIGSREFHYLLTPVGFFLGVWLSGAAGLHAGAPMSGPPKMTESGAKFAGAAAIIIALFLMHRFNRRYAARRIATIAIVAFHFAITALVGAWTYSDAIARLALGGMVETGTSLALFVAVLAGAVAGGRGQAQGQHFSLQRAPACLAGGALMGLGAVLVPGGNDSLLLQGLPTLQPAAMAALATMVATIAACITIGSRLRRPPQPPHPASSA